MPDNLTTVDADYEQMMSNLCDGCGQVIGCSCDQFEIECHDVRCPDPDRHIHCSGCGDAIMLTGESGGELPNDADRCTKGHVKHRDCACSTKNDEAMPADRGPDDILEGRLVEAASILKATYDDLKGRNSNTIESLSRMPLLCNLIGSLTNAVSAESQHAIVRKTSEQLPYLRVVA